MAENLLDASAVMARGDSLRGPQYIPSHGTTDLRRFDYELNLCFSCLPLSKQPQRILVQKRRFLPTSVRLARPKSSFIEITDP